MLARYGINEVFFSLKCFAAAMLAYFVALRLGLTRPFWAVTTAYIIANPMAGAVFSKAVFRVSGTLVGAAIAIFTVPVFVNFPEFMTLLFALWLGLCVYVSRLDRTPRSYFFLLSGYTVCIIGFPSVGQPHLIFDTAALRVQEITLGLLCGTLVHSLLTSQTVTSVLFSRIHATLQDAERWTRDSLRQEAPLQLADDRRRLALDIGELHQLSTHLPFDTARFLPRTRTLRALQDQLSMLLPLATGVEDRLQTLAAIGAVPADVQQLVDDIILWLETLPEGDDDGLQAQMLIARAAALEPKVKANLDFTQLNVLSLLSRLAELIAAHRNCRDLDRQLRSRSRTTDQPHVAALLAEAARRPLHRDHRMALRCGLASALSVIATTGLWILTDWSSGASAVMMAGIFCALFSAADQSSVLIRQMFWGNMIGFVAAMIYAFGIFPRVTSFEVLVGVLAPALLILGMILSQRRHVPLCMGTILGFFGAVGLSDHYDVNFALLVNNGLAAVIGPAIAALCFQIIMATGADSSTKHIIRAGWKELATESASPTTPNKGDWTSRMLDRVGLLVPRLASLRRDPSQPMVDVLVDLRVGRAVADLRILRLTGPAEDQPIWDALLNGVAAHYQAILSGALPFQDESPLLRQIDQGLKLMIGHRDPQTRRDGLLALMTLRRNLFPQSLSLAA